MTFAAPAEGSPRVRSPAVVRAAVGSRRYQQYLADVGGVLWRLPMAFHIEEKRWFHMNGAFLTPDPDPDARGRRRRCRLGLLPSATPALRRRRLRSARHALERQLRLLSQRRAQPGAATPVSGRLSHARSPSWASLARRATARAPSTRARNARSGAALRAAPGAARRSHDRESRRGCRRRAPPICAGAATASGSATTSPVPGARRSVRPRRRPGVCTARRCGATRRCAESGRRLRRALLGRRHPALDRLRIPGAAAVARARARPA